MLSAIDQAIAAKSRRASAKKLRDQSREIARQRAQLASACWVSVTTTTDTLEMLESGDIDGARVALLNLRDRVRADLTGARARP